MLRREPARSSNDEPPTLAQVPVVFDELQNQSLVRSGMVDIVDLGIGRNHEEGKALAIATVTNRRSGIDVVTARPRPTQSVGG